MQLHSKDQSTQRQKSSCQNSFFHLIKKKQNYKLQLFGRVIIIIKCKSDQQAFDVLYVKYKHICFRNIKGIKYHPQILCKYFMWSMNVDTSDS